MKKHLGLDKYLFLLLGQFKRKNNNSFPWQMRLSISIELSLQKGNLSLLTWHMGSFHFQRWKSWLGWRALDKISRFTLPIHKRNHLGLMGRKNRQSTHFSFFVVLLNSFIAVAYNHRQRRERLVLLSLLFPSLLCIGFCALKYSFLM